MMCFYELCLFKFEKKSVCLFFILDPYPDFLQYFFSKPKLSWSSKKEVSQV